MHRTNLIPVVCVGIQVYTTKGIRFSRLFLSIRIIGNDLVGQFGYST